MDARGNFGEHERSVRAQAAQVRDTRARGIYNLMINAIDAVRTSPCDGSGVVLQWRRLRISNYKTLYGV